ncbi:MAG: hypothetical protein O9333_01640 [Beijerinckiaceae bacterium]|nr:hypothetical protein [Beijerinckiaceae bacterium]
MLAQIWKDSTLVKLAMLGLLVGLGFIGYGHLSGLPDRAELQVVDGTVTGASKVTKKRRKTGTTSIHYELTVKPQKAGEPELKLTIPEAEITEMSVRSIITRPVHAEFDSEKDVYVLSSGSRELLSYASTLERRKLGLRQYQVDGVAILAASSAVMMIMGGYTAFRIRRRRDPEADAAGA